MSLESTIGLLTAHPAFSALEREALRILAFSSDRVAVPAGTRLFDQGTPADAAFVLVNGRLDLERIVGGRSRTVGQVPEGGLVGELALVAETERPVSAVARTAVEVIRIQRSVFRRLLDEYPRGASEIRGRIAERLQALSEALGGVRGALDRVEE